MVIVTAQRRKSGDIVWQRRQQARRAADRKLADARTALAAGRAADALRTVRSALLGLIADMRNMVAEGLTAAEAEAALCATAVPVEERAAVARLLEEIDSAEYGSGMASAAPAMIDSAAQLIPRLARHLERGT
jgi:hypothetical protein